MESAARQKRPRGAARVSEAPERVTRKRAKRSKRLLELLRTFIRTLSETASKATDEVSLLDALCQQIAQLGGYRGVWIGYPQDDAGKTVRVVARAGEDSEYINSTPVSWGDAAGGRNPVATAVTTGKAAVARNACSDSFFDGRQNEAMKLGYSSAAVPIMHNDDLLGTLNIYSVEPGAFDAEEIAIISEIAANLAYAIHNLRTQAIGEAKAQALQQSYEVQAALNSLLKLALEDTTCEELAQKALDVILSLPWLKIEPRGSIFLTGSTPDVLEMRVEKGLDDALKTTCARVPFGRCLCGKAASEKRLQFTSTLTPEHEITYEGMVAHGHYCVPIILDDRVFGVLNTYVKEGHQYDEQEAEALTTIANLLAMIIRHRSVQEELLRHQQKLRAAMQSAVEALASAVEIRDPYTSGHQQRVARLATAIAEEMQLPLDQIEAVRIAGIIHDVGKLYVPTDILNKPGRLSDIEFSLIKQHSEMGYEIIKNVDFPWPIAEIVRQHHERLDGSGYPGGLKDGEILLEAKILAVADVVEAMSSHRPYRPALGTGVALEEIARNSGRLYDPEVVKACWRLFYEKGFKL